MLNMLKIYFDFIFLLNQKSYYSTKKNYEKFCIIIKHSIGSNSRKYLNRTLKLIIRLVFMILKTYLEMKHYSRIMN